MDSDVSASLSGSASRGRVHGGEFAYSSTRRCTTIVIATLDKFFGKSAESSPVYAWRDDYVSNTALTCQLPTLSDGFIARPLEGSPRLLIENCCNGSKAL